MSDDKRASIRARVQETSKDEVVLEEMIRLGFWRENAAQPSLPAELIKHQGDVRRELETLAKDASAYANPERALKLLQAERMKAARERRVETKLRNAKIRQDRATAWHARQGQEVTHLGEGVSAALQGATGKLDRLKALKLPVLEDAAGLAKGMGVKLGEVRFLAYNRKVSKVDHYARFTIPKRTGGVREIAAPMPRLKRSQYWILVNILEPLALHDAAHGFRAKRSILTNAAPHTGQRVVINLDLKDFFPTITYRRVKGFFVSLGYPEKVAAPLALICTDAERDKLAIDGQTWSVAREQRRLPQGAPTSPAIANLIATRLDKRMRGAASKLGFTYTRYADDMTFSGNAAPNATAVNRLLWQLGKIAEAEGFTFNAKKTRIMGSGTRQDVTGLVVNERPAVARHERRRFRAWLHASETARRSGAPLPAWTNAKGTPSDGLGFASYLAMVDSKTGPALVARTKALYAGARPAVAKAAAKSAIDFRKASALGKAPLEKWWTPAEPAAPLLERVAQTKSAKPATQPVPAPEPTPQGTTVPGVPRANPAPQRTQVAKPAANLLHAVLMSLVLLPLIAIPVAGPLAVVVGLWWIWRTYFGNRGGR